MQHAGGLAFSHPLESLLSQIHCHICCASLVFTSEGYFPSLSRETRGGWQEIINSIFHLASFTTRQRTICEVIQGVYGRKDVRCEESEQDARERAVETRASPTRLVARVRGRTDWRSRSQDDWTLGTR